MDRRTVPAKTDKGVEEIARRTYKIPARLRSILIMVDGVLTAEAIMNKAAALGEVEQSLDRLMEDGFVQDIRGGGRTLPSPSPPTLPPIRSAGAPYAVPPSTSHPSELPPPAEPRTRPPANLISIPAVKQKMVEMMYDALGPAADDLNRLIEQCKTREQLAQQARACIEVLRSSAGARKADQFRDQVQVLFS